MTHHHATRRSRPGTGRRAVALSAATLALALLAGCGALTKEGTDTGAASKGSTATGQYTFTAHTDAGTTSIPADKPAVLLFFSVECGGCGPTANALAAARAADPAAADYALVDVAGYETPADIEQFIDDNDATGLGWAIDKNGTLTKAYGITQLSTVAIVTPDGQVTYRGVEPDADTIHAELAKAAR